jgi:DNA-binding transcriptional LysR family regulator
MSNSVRPLGLDPDLLRTFLLIAEEGSFTRAAARVGRTQSAVSMQIQRLEAALGQPVLLRGRGGAVALTPHGRYLRERGRDLLSLNDEIWSNFHAPSVHGTVRLGTPDDYAFSHLPKLLKRFADRHPAVEVEVTCVPSSEVVEGLRAGDFDLGLCSEGHEPEDWPTTTIWRGPLRWVSSERYAPHRLDPLPLALAGQDCSWRRIATACLGRAGRRYRIAYTSSTLTGTFAPVLAGLAVTVSAGMWLPPGLHVVPPGDLLPPLSDTAVFMLLGRAPHQPLTNVLAQHLAGGFDDSPPMTAWGTAERAA